LQPTLSSAQIAAGKARVVKFTAPLLALVFFVAGIASDVCFGQLLKRWHAVAPEDWRAHGRPTWWTWRPSEFVAPRWYYNAPRWRWLWSSPRYFHADGLARRLHMRHRGLALLAIGAWAAFLILGMTGQFSK
jgi:hypothetical protein